MRIAEGIVTARGGTASPRRRGRPRVGDPGGLWRRHDYLRPSRHAHRRRDDRRRRHHLDRRHHRCHLRWRPRRGRRRRKPRARQLLGWADGVRNGAVGGAGECRQRAADAAASQGARSRGDRPVSHRAHVLGRTLALGAERDFAGSDEAAAAALDALGAMQKSDFIALLEAMDGLPVTVRLLDPPLHEFLPSATELAVAEALGQLDADQVMLAAAVHHWSEQNPMLGTRGVRLAIVRDGLYRMQVRSLLEAVAVRVAAGGTPIVGIMIPLVSDVAELDTVKAWIATELAAADPTALGRITVGTMIETPRAALTAATIASSAEFFSFGTNDLTQLTWGFSRDDVEAPRDQSVHRAGHCSMPAPSSDSTASESARWLRRPSPMVERLIQARDRCVRRTRRRPGLDRVLRGGGRRLCVVSALIACRWRDLRWPRRSAGSSLTDVGITTKTS